MTATFVTSGTKDVASHDIDPVETIEWRESFEAVLRELGSERALYLLGQLEAEAREHGISFGHQPFSAYRNTISLPRITGLNPSIVRLTRRTGG